MGLETIHPQVLPRLNKSSTFGHFSRGGGFLRKEGIADAGVRSREAAVHGRRRRIGVGVKSAAFRLFLWRRGGDAHSHSEWQWRDGAIARGGRVRTAPASLLERA